MDIVHAFLRLLFFVFAILRRVIFWKVNQPKAKYAFDCPRCHELRMAVHRDATSISSSPLVLRTQCEARLLTCETCGFTFNFESFEADKEGIYRVKTWDCPNCSHLSPCTSYSCVNCGYKLA